MVNLAELLKYTHHNAATQAADGAVAYVEGCSTVTVFINRTAGTSTVKFWGSEDLAKTAPVALQGVNTTTGSIAVQTTGSGEAWEIDVRGFKYFFAELDAVATGPVTVTSYAQP